MSVSKVLSIVLAMLTLGAPQAMSETYTNKLAQEKSPYLLQHAHNPVDWYPWGEEAFRKARKENKPIFLSIGYSTCHWCHVMEEESFVNPEIAKVLNEYFVAIKVDREERPDIDHIYMQATMAMTGSGGWPMSVFLTLDLKPFYAGTYFPPTDRWGRPGFLTVLNAIHQKWKNDRDHIKKSSEELTKAIQEEAAHKGVKRQTLDETVLQKAYEQFASRFDSEKGGFSEAPKFPQAHIISFLLRYWKRSKDPRALEMVEKTLQGMARGGMYDQMGGGFHRYSTDENWHVPHFEKMLYDQAVLARAYLEAYQATERPEYAQVAREIFDYVLGDMTDSEGGFYSAEDADSLPAGKAGAPDPGKPKEKREGAFYVWSHQEIETHLGTSDVEIFNYYFGVELGGNAAHDPQGEFKGKNILYVKRTLEETAKKFERTPAEINQILKQAKTKLFEIRKGRPRPHLDDKVLTDWNGLMISSLAFGSRVLGEERYMKAAQKASDFILKNSVIASPAKQGAAISGIASVASLPRNDGQGRLMHRYRDEEGSGPGVFEGYAVFANGPIDLYEATFDPHYLEEAQFFANEMIRLFWDRESGGFFFTANDAEALISRTKEIYDGAVPSGNSVAVLALFRLSRFTMDPRLETKAQEAMDAFSHQLAQYPARFSQMMMALDFVLGPTREIVISGDAQDQKLPAAVHKIYSLFLPNKVVIFHPSKGEAVKRIEAISPFLKNQPPLSGALTIYVCKNYVCNLPTSELEKLSELLVQ